MDRVIKYLGAAHAANRNNWKGHFINNLAIVYRAYVKLRKRLELILRRYSLSEVIWRKCFNEIEKNLVWGVFYAYGAKIEGDIVEFGTQTGRTARVIAKAARALDGVAATPPKNLHLFDSFEGLPPIESAVDISSPYVVAKVWNPGSLKGLSEAELTRVCARWLPRERILVHAGWFKDTLPQLPDDTKFALLHIDSDLYQSAMDVLEICFSRGFIAEGAIVFFDDWNMNKASTEFGERRAWLEIVEKYSVKYSDEGAYSWNAHKFIVHSYKRK